MPPPTDNTAPPGLPPSEAESHPLGQDNTFVAQAHDQRKLSPREALDTTIVQGCMGMLKIVRVLIRLASPNARDAIAIEANKTACAAQEAADSFISRADEVWDKLLVALDDREDRWRRR